MKRVIFCLLFLPMTMVVFAQGHQQAVGIRGGLSSGFEYRYYLDSSSSLKLLLSTRDRGLQLHGLYEVHQPAPFFFSDRISFFYGAGIHAGYQSWYQLSYSGTYQRREIASRPLLGLDGLAGLEYTFREIPVSLGIEAKPFLDFWGRYGFDARPFDFAFTIKYLF